MPAAVSRPASGGPAWPAPMTMASKLAGSSQHPAISRAPPIATASSIRAAGRSLPKAAASRARSAAPPSVPMTAPTHAGDEAADAGSRPRRRSRRRRAPPVTMRAPNCAGTLRLGVDGSLSVTSSPSARKRQDPGRPGVAEEGEPAAVQVEPAETRRPAHRSRRRHRAQPRHDTDQKREQIESGPAFLHVHLRWVFTRGYREAALESSVLHKPTEKTTRGPLRALSDWLRGTPPPAPSGVDPAAPASREGLPSRIGHYAVTGKLGQGGMGVVYLARDERLGRSVAVKMMSSVGGDETARKRFWREARAAASINHPNVCQLYEIGEDAGDLFIAMELLEGEPLGDRLQRGPLSVAEALPIGFGILAALSALHGRGIVHRDLKPSNVFLTPHGVKLLDFGLARASDSDLSPALPAATELTGTGMVLGTPRYMAPEQVTGEGLDARSDLFAVGAILFEMLAGRPAFGGRNAVEILHATLYEQPPALTGSPAVAAADRVIRRALSKRPSERPATRRGDGRGAARGERHGRRAVSRPGPHPDARRGPALPHPAPRSRDRLPGLQPPGRDRHVPVAHRLARGALERSRLPVRRGSAGPQGPGRRGGRRPGGDGDARARGRPAAGRHPARRGPGGHAPHLAHRPVLAGRPLPAPGRHRPACRGGARAPARRAGPAHARGAAQRPRVRALSPGERARPQLRSAPPGA